jgi:putative ABC transport system permease protein
MLTLSLTDLGVAFIPVIFVLGLMWRFQYPMKKPLLALSRMLLQLIIIGYFLLYIFAQKNQWLVLAILLTMMLIASWIALNVVEVKTVRLYLSVLTAIVIGGCGVLFIMTIGVLHITPWYQPRILIPLAGMTFSSAMTAISIALERFEAEKQQQKNTNQATNKSFQAAMIPVVNSLFAVGLVALPGMMTGQILSGVEPYIAARYQIMVMCMIFATSGLSVFIFLKLHTSQHSPDCQQQ